MDDPGVLRHRDESVGGHQSLAWVVPAHQSFDRLDRTRRECDLRLVVEHELALGDGSSQLACEAGTAQRLRLLLGLVQRKAAA